MGHGRNRRSCLEVFILKKSALAVIPLGLLAVGLFTAGAFVRHRLADADPPHGILWAAATRPPFSIGEGNMDPKDVFQTVLESLKSDYVDGISDQKKLTYGAIEAMVEALHDPYSLFLTPERRKSVEEAENGQFHGLGAILLPQRAHYKDVTYERLTVANVLPGSPAEKAGLVPGDIIARIGEKYFFQMTDDVLPEDVDPTNVRALFPEVKDDEEINLLSYKDALDQLSQDGKTVTLGVVHANQTKPVDVKVALATTTVTPVTSRMAEDGVGYLSIRGLTKNSSAQVQKALGELSSQGAKSLVVDLRDSFGGPLDQAKEIAARFTKGPLGYVVRQKSGKQPIAVASSEPFSGRVVVLVNRATLGTSELIAAALEEELKAPVVGTATFGDGLDQTLIPLDDGSAIQLTTGKFLTAGGADFNQKGIKPTRLVADSPAKQMEAALALAKAPGTSGV
jgi:carboxyl-terminal processing protease